MVYRDLRVEPQPGFLAALYKVERPFYDSNYGSSIDRNFMHQGLCMVWTNREHFSEYTRNSFESRKEDSFHLLIHRGVSIAKTGEHATISQSCSLSLWAFVNSKIQGRLRLWASELQHFSIAVTHQRFVESTESRRPLSRSSPFYTGDRCNCLARQEHLSSSTERQVRKTNQQILFVRGFHSSYASKDFRGANWQFLRTLGAHVRYSSFRELASVSLNRPV